MKDDLQYSTLGEPLTRLYRFRRFRKYWMKFVLKLEKGVFVSGTARAILEKYHGVSVGAYSYGECMVPGSFPPGVTVGRYASIATGARIYLRNHPPEHLSLHPYFYNRHLGYVKEDMIQTGKMEIGHDAWIGYQAIFLPSCNRVGIGAIVGAGAVVTKDVPDFAIVGGNPAKLIRYRFNPEICAQIIESRWWERSIEEILPFMNHMTRPMPEDATRHPLLTPSRFNNI